MDSHDRPHASRLPSFSILSKAVGYPLRRQHKEMPSVPTRAPTKWMPAGLAHDDKCIAHHSPCPVCAATSHAHRSHPLRPTCSRASASPATTLATLTALTTLPDRPQHPPHPRHSSPSPRHASPSPPSSLGATTLTRYIAALLHGVKTPRLLEHVMAETPRKPLRPLALQRIVSEECQGAYGIGFERWVHSMQSYL